MEKIASPTELRRELKKLLVYARTPKPSRSKLSGDLQALSIRLAASNAKVSTFLMILTSYLTQYDEKEIAKETKKGGEGNIYRLGLMFQTSDKVKHDVHAFLDSDTPDAMEALKASLGRRFNALRPVDKLIKQIDAWVESGKLPKLGKL